MGVRQREEETVEKGARSAPAGAARERARRSGETLERYVRGTDLDWMDERSHPLDGEPVIVTYEEQGAVRHLRTCWLRAAGGWREPWLRGRKLYWVHDPPL
jgi:hypothetical protein